MLLTDSAARRMQRHRRPGLRARRVGKHRLGRLRADETARVEDCRRAGRGGRARTCGPADLLVVGRRPVQPEHVFDARRRAGGHGRAALFGRSHQHGRRAGPRAQRDAGGGSRCARRRAQRGRRHDRCRLQRQTSHACQYHIVSYQ